MAGASKGEGLGNQFLANIRETDAIVHVVRCFEDPNVIHVANKVDPLSDIEVINTELALADLAAAEKQLSRNAKVAKTGGDKEAQRLVAVLEKAIAALDQGKPVRSVDLVEGRAGGTEAAVPAHHEADHVRGERGRERLQGQPSACGGRGAREEGGRAGGGDLRRAGSRRSPT